MSASSSLVDALDRAAEERPQRVSGVDAARGLALLGMFVAHVAPDVASGDLTQLLSIADERPRLLFALTAGIGLGFISGGDRPIALERGRLRRQIAIRAVVLILLGMLIWFTLHPLVFIILDVYGVAFLLLLPFIFLPPRLMLGIGIGVLAAAPALAEIGARSEFVNEVRQTPLKFVSDWVVGGAYPVIVWAPVMLIGLALTRFDLSSRRVIGVLALGGVAAASVLLPSAATLPPPNEVTQAPWSAALQASAEALGNVGIAAAVIAGLVALTTFAKPRARRVAGVMLLPIVAMGSMPLTIYTFHLVVLGLAVHERNGVRTDDSWALLAGLVVGAMVFAVCWRRYIGRGPLEILLRRISGRGRQAR